MNSPLRDVPTAVNTRLDSYLAESAEEFGNINPVVGTAIDTLRGFILNGGKRVRPTFAWAGVRAGLSRCPAPQEHTNLNEEQLAENLLTAISALEFIQACALIHDDIIDASDTRRGHPTAHRIFETHHRDQQWLGSAEHYGVSQAILCGDLAFSWADDMFNGSGLPAPALERARPAWRAMRTEVIAGQILDIAVEANGSESTTDSMSVITYKTASYTVARPLHLGAALVGADATTIDLLRRIGHDIGVAFQLRDDQLGVFGDPAVTGKPAGDDLRSGKRTTLINYALSSADHTTADQLRAGLGDPQADIDSLKDIIVGTGADKRIEDLINEHSTRAIDAIQGAEFAPEITDELTTLAAKLTNRSF